jgi:copper resistance protein B
MKHKGELILVLGWMPSLVAAGQQPTEPGWPQPMNNDRSFGYAILDQNELRSGDGRNAYRWEGEGWYGGNIDRAWFKTEGDLSTDSGNLEEGELQALYSHAISP